MSNGGGQIDAMLRHLGSGHDLQNFPGTPDEKLALILTAAAHGLIAWSKARGRFELTPIALRPETPTRGSGSASLVVGTTVGAVIAAGALAALWLPADASHHPDGRQAPAPVSRPADPGGGLRIPPQTASASPVALKVYTDQMPTAQPAVPPEPAHPVPIAQPVAPTKPAEVARKVHTDPVPTAQPIPTEPARVAEQPIPEQPTATATRPTTKQAAVKKPRHKTANARTYQPSAGANLYRDERYAGFR